MPSRSRSARKPAAEFLAGARVLLVDDHAFTINLIKDVIYASGAAQVFAARDGAEAITLLASCQPHLVVTDWRMPGMDGLAFAEIVRRAALRPDPRIPDPQVPIVLLSAHTSAKAVETARRAGVNEVVVKPFTVAALLKRLVAAATRPREFVVSEAYVGPDRRRRQGVNAGRRAGDAAQDSVVLMDASILRQLHQRLTEVEAGKRPAKARAGGAGR
jgi:CheY-like chemotaxis protein